jgi:replicative DNA helicase
MNRVMISVPEDIEKEIERLKQTEFYDKPYAEIYRSVIRRGLEEMQKEDR